MEHNNGNEEALNNETFQQRADLTESPDFNPDNLHVFIDNSNIFVSAKQFSAHKLDMLLTEDVCCRIDAGKLLDMVTSYNGSSTRKLGACPCIFGTTAKSDTFWRKAETLGFSTYTGSHSKYSGKEKEVDTAVVAYAVRALFKEKPRGTLVIFSGDRDMRPLLDIAGEEGWAVELWAFIHSRNQIYEEYRDRPNCNLVELSDLFDSFTYREVFWGAELPLDRSLVLELSNEKRNMNQSDYKKFLAVTSERLSKEMKQPIQTTCIQGLQNIVVIIICSDSVALKARAKKDATIPYTDVIAQNINELAWNEGWGHVHYYRDYCKESSKDVLKVQPLEDTNPFALLSGSVEANQLAPLVPELPTLLQTASESGGGSPDKGEPFALIPSKNSRSKDPCPFKFWCRKPQVCGRTHSPAEKEWFDARKKITSIPEQKWHEYKFKICNRQDERHLKLPKHLCFFAHGKEDLRCDYCGNWGHDYDNCKARNVTD